MRGERCDRISYHDVRRIQQVKSTCLLLRDGRAEKACCSGDVFSVRMEEHAWMVVLDPAAA